MVSTTTAAAAVAAAAAAAAAAVAAAAIAVADRCHPQGCYMWEPKSISTQHHGPCACGEL